MDEKFIKKLVATLKCGVCGQQYEGSNFSVLGHRNKMWFLNATCPACQTQAMIAVVVKEGKPAEVVTELTEAELAKFAQESALESDDILDIHNFLKSFDGDFSKLFGKN